MSRTNSRQGFTQRGFTLIELVVVIVILGILAATVVPKYIHLTYEARFALRESLDAAMRSASTMIHAKAMASGQTGASGSITFSGVTINTVHGYAANVTELAKALDFSASEFTVVPGVSRIEISKAEYPEWCHVGYAAPYSASDEPVFWKDSGGCQ